MGFGRRGGERWEKAVFMRWIGGGSDEGAASSAPTGRRTRTSVPKTLKFGRTVWLAELHLLGHRGKRSRPLLWPHVADEV